MHDLAGVGMVEGLASLARNVLQIPNRKSFLAGQHVGNAFSLHVFHCRAEISFDVTRTVEQSDVVAAERLGGIGLREDALHQLRRPLLQQVERDRL